MNAHVLLIYQMSRGKEIKCSAILSLFHNEFNKLKTSQQNYYNLPNSAF